MDALTSRFMAASPSQDNSISQHSEIANGVPGNHDLDAYPPLRARMLSSEEQENFGFVESAKIAEREAQAQRGRLPPEGGARWGSVHLHVTARTPSVP